MPSARSDWWINSLLLLSSCLVVATAPGPSKRQQCSPTGSGHEVKDQVKLGLWTSFAFRGCWFNSSITALMSSTFFGGRHLAHRTAHRRVPPCPVWSGRGRRAGVAELRLGAEPRARLRARARCRGTRSIGGRWGRCMGGCLAAADAGRDAKHRSLFVWMGHGSRVMGSLQNQCGSEKVSRIIPKMPMSQDPMSRPCDHHGPSPWSFSDVRHVFSPS